MKSESEKEFRQKELGEFLRYRREHVSPPEALRVDPHRRAKGLRRSEVASQVSISEEWYTHLEQGRTEYVSTQVLLRLARVFDLSPVETDYVCALADKRLSSKHSSESSAVPAYLRHFLEAQSPCPGYIIDHHWDALAWNDGAQALLYDLAALPRRRRNVLVQVFTDPTFRGRLADWESHAKTVLAFFRRDYGLSPADPRIREVVAELQAKSEEFRRWWPLQKVEDHIGVRFVWSQPGQPTLVFDRLTFFSGGNSNLRVVVFHPVPNTDTEQVAAHIVAEHRRRRNGTEQKAGGDGVA